MSKALTSDAPASPKRRTWCYAQPPGAYEISGCSCGNNHPTWSEFEGHLWCQICEKDFVPEHNGVFGGPIPVQTAALLGVRFDRINLLTQALERFDVQRLAYLNETGEVVEELGKQAATAAMAAG